MKKDSFLPLIRGMGILLMLLWSLQLKAQTPNTAVLTWDQQVGCITYDDDPKDMPSGEQHPLYTGISLSENILDGSCIRFCEDTVVTFSLNTNDEVEYVEWAVSGGILEDNSNSHAKVVWEGRGSGSITLTIFYGDGTVSTRTFCVEKIARPMAFYQMKGPNPNQTNFIVNTNVSFKNLSTANGGTSLVSYVWDFGDGQVSTALEPVHQYTVPGNYQVKLTVANSCNCTTVYYKTLYIDIPIPGCPYPILSCVSMTCEGNIEHYSVNDPSGGVWTVDGGTILGSNTSPNIDVRWDQIDPDNGYGTLTYESNCWPYPINEYIPVIISRATIRGPKDFYEGEQQLFMLPSWPTTEFDWELNGIPANDPNNHFLTHTQNRNEILVGSLPAGTYHLTARYRNTLLRADNCRGEAELYFTVNEKPVIQRNGPLVFCVAEKIDFTSASGNPVNWEIYLGSNLVHTDKGVSTYYDFDKVGTYVVTAESNGCIGDPILVEALPVPEITGNITGPQTVCLNVPYTYTINENDPSAFYSWSISGGNIIGSNGGTQVDVYFTAANATVTVEKKYVNKGVTCTSQSISYPVNELVFSPAIVNNNSTTQFCPSTTYTFTADLNGVVPDNIEWELTPPNFGNIIAGANSNTVTLTLNEVSNNNTTGVLQLTVTKCGVEEVRTININMFPKVNVSIGAIDDICPTLTTFPVDITANVPNGTMMEFEYNGVPGGTSQAYNSAVTTYQVEQLFLADTNAVAGVLAVKLVNPYGCTTTVAAYKNVTILPKTTVELYQVAGGVRICPPAQPAASITLKATASTGVTADAQYNWYYNNDVTPFATTLVPVLTLSSSNLSGNYYVQVTDVNGCIITSNSINFFGCSGGGDDDGGDGDGSHCNLSFNGTPTLTYNWTKCDEVTVTANFNSTPSAPPTWSQSQPGFTLLSSSIVSTVAQATYKITRAGIHNVLVTAYYAGCDYGFTRSVKIEKNYEPILRYAVTCGANGNYTIQLKNNTKLFDRTLAASNIRFYDITSGIPVLVPGSPGQTVTINKTAGTYKYKMVLSGMTQPPTEAFVCEPEVTIVIANPPSTNVQTPDPAQNNTYCAEEPILVVVPGVSVLNSNYRYEWHFNGTQYVAKTVNSYINITDPGTHTITLKIINDHGCEFVSAPINVTIIKAAFDGGIDPADPDYCETDALPLEYKLSNPVSPSNPAPTTITWMRDDQVVHTGTSYQPTQSGSYWAVLTDANGCKDYSLVKTPVLYKLRKPPFASVKGNTSVCYGESTTLVGIYTDPTVEHRWTLNDDPIPGSLGNWISGANNLDITHTGTTPGTYTYTFETRRTSGDTDCIGKFEAVVVVHPPVGPLFIDISFTCYYQNQTYRHITLTAMGGDPNGTYSWSTGENTESIILFDGGVYTLTYTAPTGCTATSTVNIPKYPDNYMWVVPKGCYQICGSDNAYLLGPLGTYEEYKWYRNGGMYLASPNVAGMGPYYIPPVYINQPGINIFDLNIMQNGCWTGLNHLPPQITVLACRPGTGSKGTAAETTPTTAVNSVTATFVLAPNPVVDVATVIYDTGTQNATAVTVYNLKGAQLLQQQVSGTKGEIQLNVSRLAAGTYMVNLHAGNTVIAQQKLIKR